MRSSTRFSASVHILTLLALHRGQKLTSRFIAGSVNTNQVVIRRLLGLLRKAGIVESTPGQNGGWSLKRAPTGITLSEIFVTVEPGLFLTYHKDTNPACVVGRNIQSALVSIYTDTQEILEAFLQRSSIQGVLASVLESEERSRDGERVAKDESKSIKI